MDGWLGRCAFAARKTLPTLVPTGFEHQGHRLMRLLLLSGLSTIVALSLPGCASGRHAVPEARELSLPPLKYDLIREQRIAVHIRDLRPESEFSSQLVETLEQAISGSLKQAEVPVDPTATDVLEVRVEQYGATLRLGEWKGCARLSAALRAQGKVEESSAEQCVTETNADGVNSGDRATGRALGDALVLLLHQVDRQGR